jgi:hypothetical protein
LEGRKERGTKGRKEKKKEEGGRTKKKKKRKKKKEVKPSHVVFLSSFSLVV